MTIHIPIYLPCHLILHSFHYHLVISGHLILSTIRFLTLIKIVRVQSSADYIVTTLLKFEIYSAETTLSPISLLINILYLYMHVLEHFNA
jgi:hypothetical protein